MPRVTPDQIRQMKSRGERIPMLTAYDYPTASILDSAGVPMLPNVAGPAETKRQMLIYTLILWPCALAPALLGVCGWIYGAAAVILSAAFTVCAVRVLYDPGERAARQMFGFSILYLFLLFALMVIDRAPGLSGALG